MIISKWNYDAAACQGPVVAGGIAELASWAAMDCKRPKLRDRKRARQGGGWLSKAGGSLRKILRGLQCKVIKHGAVTMYANVILDL